MQIGDTLEEYLVQATDDAGLRQVLMSMSEAIRTIAFKVGALLFNFCYSRLQFQVEWSCRVIRNKLIAYFTHSCLWLLLLLSRSSLPALSRCQALLAYCCMYIKEKMTTSAFPAPPEKSLTMCSWPSSSALRTLSMSSCNSSLRQSSLPAGQDSILQRSQLREHLRG